MMIAILLMRKKVDCIFLKSASNLRTLTENLSQISSSFGLEKAARNPLPSPSSSSCSAFPSPVPLSIPGSAFLVRLIFLPLFSTHSFPYFHSISFPLSHIGIGIGILISPPLLPLRCSSSIRLVWSPHSIPFRGQWARMSQMRWHAVLAMAFIHFWPLRLHLPLAFGFMPKRSNYFWDSIFCGNGTKFQMPSNYYF
jgi:hypothetical protein